MAGDRKYTESQRQQALEIWRTRGVTAAANTIGCNRGTIYNWVKEEGLVGTQDKEAIYQHYRQKLKYKLMHRAYFLMRQMISPQVGYAHYQGGITEYPIELPSAVDQKNYAIAVSILLDRIALMEGEPTSRVEAIDGNLLERELTNLANELADKAKGLEVKELPTETDLAAKLRDMESKIGNINMEGNER